MSWIQYVARCHSCGKTTSNPKAKNWILHQLCYQCARKIYPLEYEGQPDHGTGGSRMQHFPTGDSMIIITKKELEALPTITQK